MLVYNNGRYVNSFPFIKIQIFFQSVGILYTQDLYLNLFYLLHIFTYLNGTNFRAFAQKKSKMREN